MATIKRSKPRRLKTLDPYYQITPYLMRTRQDASNYFEDHIEVTEIDRFLKKLRTEGYKGIGMLHLVIAAYIRTISQRPALNRFICGQRIYSRDQIEYVMTIKKSMDSAAGETSIKVLFDPSDTIIDVYNRINEQIDLVRKEASDTSTDAAAAMFMKFPRFILRFLIWIVRCLDYYNLLPTFLLNASPFHASMIISDLGSIGIPPIYHHLYDFGTIPVFITMGAKRREYELDKEGKVIERKYVDYTVVTDERICDGFYYAQSFKHMKNFLRHPELLLSPPDTVIKDIGA